MRSHADRAAGGHKKHLLGYGAVLALTAGFVNAVALLILAFPVGNLTAVTTQIGMNTANPWMYEGHLLVAILSGFLVGAVLAGLLLGPSQTPADRRHAVVLVLEAVLLLVAAGVEENLIRAQLAALGVEESVFQAMFAAAALGLQNGLSSSFRGMAVRTTHFTGTVTDLGLIIGRSVRHRTEKWKAAILAVTLLLFAAGAVAGVVFGARFGSHALIVPAVICMMAATVSACQSRVHRSRANR
ncbi:YoaK family protein [Mycobacterium sp. ML4]